MKKYAVAYYSLFTNELTLKIISANGWYEALMQHPNLKDYELPNTSLEAAKIEAWNCDAGIDIIEIF